MPRLAAVIPSLGLVFALATGAVAQQAEPPAVDSLTAAIAAPAVVAAPPGAAVQEPAPLPRSQRPYWHVFGAFAVAWLLLIGYLVSLGRRFSGLEEDVRRLERGTRGG